MDPRTALVPTFYAAAAGGDFINESRPGMLLLVKNNGGSSITVTLAPATPGPYPDSPTDVLDPPDGPFFGLPAAAWQFTANPGLTFVGPFRAVTYRVVIGGYLPSGLPVEVREGHGIGILYSSVTNVQIAVLDAYHVLF